MQYQEYQRLYKNAKAKERRLKKNHNVDIDINLLTPTQWKSSRNKKRESDKLSRFTSRDNPRYQYVKLGSSSIKKNKFDRINEENQRIISRINYHKNKNLKATLGLPYLVYSSSTDTVMTTDSRITDRLSGLTNDRLRDSRNVSRSQRNENMLLKYNKSLKKREKNIRENRYAELQRRNYIDKVRDYAFSIKGTQYEGDYKKLLKTLTRMTPDDFEKFYYLSDMGDIENLDYIGDDEVGTEYGMEKVMKNVRAIRSSWESVQAIIDTDEVSKRKVTKHGKSKKRKR